MESNKNSNKLIFLPPKKIATNRDYTLAINDFGDLYAWGNNHDERLGLKNDNNDLIEYPRKYDFFINKYLRMIEVACGNYHIAAIATNKDGSTDTFGYIFIWGLDLFGRLGYITDLRKNDREIQDQDTYVFRTTPVMLKLQDKVAKIACGTDFTACITVKGQVYSWGTNKWGNLGVENMNYTSVQYVVRQPTLVTGLVGKFIIQIACGSKHMLALTQERRIYSWGSGDYGVLGLGNTVGHNTPQLIKELANEEMITILTGDYNSGAINTNGHLYLWGNGKFGRLGTGSEENYDIPKKLEDSSVAGVKIFNCSIGFYHTICCSVDGKTFSWGYSENGRLGCIDKSECDQKKKFLTPRQVHGLLNIQICQCYAGHHHSLAISLSGKVYGWGENIHKVLGDLVTDEDRKKGITKKNILYFPEVLPLNKYLVKITGGIQDLWSTYFLSSSSMIANVKGSKKFKIRKIACGGTHTMALTESGDVLSWGYGNYGQLGLGNQRKSVGIPTLINFNTDRKFMKIYAGSAHSMAISCDVFEVYTWGDGSKGQLGKRGEMCFEPGIVDDLCGKDIIKGSCGYDFTACLTFEGKIYIFGSNANYKLGIDSENPIEYFPISMDILMGIKKISLGLNHAAVINSSGELFTWGHGFYGQLGHNDTNTIKLPKKVEFGELKYYKVKCGTYHTLAVDLREMVYIWGRSLINLSPDKNKSRPEIIDDFKISKCKNIQVGYGNSLILNKANELFGCGDNESNKAGGDYTLEKNIVKNPRYIKFESDAKNKVSIEKIFCGYQSCFAISVVGDIYAWGNPRNFRLTKDFDDKTELKPKLINITWKVDTNKKANDEEDDENKPKKIDEREILTLLNNKLRIPNFIDLFNMIEGLDVKYDDNLLFKKDEEFQDNLIKMLKSYQEIQYQNILVDPYMTVVKLQITRMNHIYVPKKIIKETKPIPKMILTNLFEIEKIYTLLYIHPCNYFEILEIIKIEEYETFINGIKPLYLDLIKFKLSSSNSELLDNMLLIATFRLLVVQDFIQFKSDIESLFSKQKSYAELILEFYFFNRFNRSILLDIFGKTLLDLKTLSESTLKKTNITVLFSIKSVLTENIQGLGEKEIFKKEHIDELLNITKSLIIDLETNIAKIPHYVGYCLKYTKKKLKKFLKEQGTYKEDKAKLKSALLRLLFKNIISKLLKRLSQENQDYLSQHLNYGNDSEVRKNIENYLPIIGELLDRIVTNSPINSDFLNNKGGEIDNKNVEDGIFMINNMIKISYLKIYNLFTNNILKVEFAFKRELISSILFDNLEFKIKKVYIDLKSLLEFLKILYKKKGKGAFFSELKIFDIFETSGAVKSQYMNFDPNYKILFYVNNKYMIEPMPFLDKFAKEIKLNENLQELNIIRCKDCGIVAPEPLILEKGKNTFIFKPFQEKVKDQYLLVFSQIVKHSYFVNKSAIITIKDLYDNLKEMQENLSKEKLEGHEQAQSIVRELEEILGEQRSEQDKLESFILLIHDHIKKKLKHYEFTNSSERIIEEIENEKINYKNKMNKLLDDLNLSKDGLKSMKNSIDINDNKEVKEQELTHVKKNFVQYNDDNIFRYRLHEESLSSLFKKGILLEFEREEKDLSNVILQLSANNNKKFFDLKLSLKKSKELLMSHSFTYEEYVYFSLNSNTFTILNFGEFGKYNCSLFLNLIHQQIKDKQ